MKVSDSRSYRKEMPSSCASLSSFLAAAAATYHGRGDWTIAQCSCNNVVITYETGTLLLVMMYILFPSGWLTLFWKIWHNISPCVYKFADETCNDAPRRNSRLVCTCMIQADDSPNCGWCNGSCLPPSCSCKPRLIYMLLHLIMNDYHTWRLLKFLFLHLISKKISMA